MTIRKKQADIGRLNLLKKQGNHKSKPNITVTKTEKYSKYKINHSAKKRKEKHRINQKTRFKMEINTYLSIITLNANRRDAPTKRQSGRLDKKAKAYNLLSTRDSSYG